MNPTVEAVKRNLDLTSSKPLKICTYEAFKKNHYFRGYSCR